MGIHFGSRAHDEGRPVTARLHTSAMSPEGLNQEGQGDGFVPSSLLAAVEQNSLEDDSTRAYAGNAASMRYADESDDSRLKEKGSGQYLDDDLLCIGLPPLPPIDTWLIEPGNVRKDREDRDAGSMDLDDFDSIKEHSDTALEAVASEQSVGKSAADRRTIPRLAFKPTQAVVVILVLVVALCASLTMLVTQAINYNRQQAQASSSVSPSTATSKTNGSERRQGNVPEAGSTTDSSQNPTGIEGQNLVVNGNAASPNPPAQTGNSTGQGGFSTSQNNLINLNTADSTQLQQIKGVGPVMAQKIIDYRSSIGHFTSVDQLLKVSGIGQKTLEKIRGQVTV